MLAGSLIDLTTASTGPCSFEKGKCSLGGLVEVAVSVSKLTLFCKALMRCRHPHDDHAALAGRRWQLLSALRSLSLGAILIVQVDPGTAERRVAIFEGQFLPLLVGSALLARDWIQPCRPHWMENAMIYGLSPLGTEALEAGLRWWNSLPLHRRLILRLTE
jgi:hypothetical protein